jgi:hypothetical protein
VFPADSGNYRVVLSNACGALTSETAHLDVLGRPWIVRQPRSQTVAVGETVSLSVEVTNTALLPLNVFWYRDANYLDWIVSSDFTVTTNLPNVQTNAAGTWEVQIDNDATALTGEWITSNPAYLTVVVPPTSQTVQAGTSITFTNLAYGPEPITYRWQHNGNDLPHDPRITGATNATLNLLWALPRDAGTYTNWVRNAAGQETGFGARLEVLKPCPELGVQLVPCAESPSGWCLQLCWPETLPNCAPAYSGGLDQTWQPWTGPSYGVGGCTCVRIPVDSDLKFIKLECAP